MRRVRFSTRKLFIGLTFLATVFAASQIIRSAVATGTAPPLIFPIVGALFASTLTLLQGFSSKDVLQRTFYGGFVTLPFTIMAAM